jgi:hypothetical protein
MIFGFLPQNLKTWTVAVGSSIAQLAGFRDELYRCFTGRADCLMDLCDAVLCADGPVRSLAELSLAPEFRRGHGALYDALSAGGIDEERVRDALAAALPEGLPLLFAVDLTTWPRPDAECSAERTHCYACCRRDGRRKTVPGWSCSRVSGVDWGTSSLGMDVVEVAPPYDQAEITSFLANRVVLEALSGMARRRRDARDGTSWDRRQPLLDDREAQ